MKRKTENSIRFVMIICIPCAVGLSVLAAPILELLFGSRSHLEVSAGLLRIGTASVVFYGMSTLTNGILQGMDKMRLPVIHAAISLVLHIVLLVVLIRFTDLNIYAVVWANIFFAVMMCILNSLSIARYMRYRQEIIRTFLVPLISSAVMGGAAYGTDEPDKTKYHRDSCRLCVGCACLWHCLVVIKRCQRKRTFRPPKRNHDRGSCKKTQTFIAEFFLLSV